MTLDTVVSILVFAFVGWRLIGGLRHGLSPSGRRNVGHIVGGIGWRHIWPIPLVLIAVSTAAYALTSLPVLSWGWWSMFGGSGNPVFGSSESTIGTVWEWVIPLIFIAMLLPALALFAQAEERMFRCGAQHWSARRRVLKTVQFGLIHALIGIPLGTALALSLGGAYFMWIYLRDYRRHGDEAHALSESTRAHTAYNAAIIVLLVVLISAATLLSYVAAPAAAATSDVDATAPTGVRS